MSELPSKITTAYLAGDWVAIYFDDKLAVEGKRGELNAGDILDALGIAAEVVTTKALSSAPKSLAKVLRKIGGRDVE